MNHLRGLEWGDENVDGHSPSLREEGVNPPWNEVDDLEHLWAAYADGGFTVAEVTGLEGDERYAEAMPSRFSTRGLSTAEKPISVVTFPRCPII